MGYRFQLYHESVTSKASAAFAIEVSKKAFELFSNAVPQDTVMLAGAANTLKNILKDSEYENILDGTIDHVTHVIESFKGPEYNQQDAIKIAYCSASSIFYALESVKASLSDLTKESAQLAARSSLYLDDALALSGQTMDQETVMNEAIEKYAEELSVGPRF